MGLLGAGSGVAIVTPVLIHHGGGNNTIVGKIDPSRIENIGNGYYLANGWVLSADDLKGFELPKANLEQERE